MGAVYGVDVGDDPGIRSVATSYDDYVGDEPQGAAGIAEALAPVGNYLDLAPLSETGIGSADAAILLDPALVRDNRTVDALYAEVAADEFIPMQGKPLAVTDLVFRIAPQMLVGGVQALETYPDPDQTTVDAQARWLPQSVRYPGSLQWFPFSVAGTEDRLVDGGVQYAALTESTWEQTAMQSWLALSGLSNVVTGAQGQLSWYASAGARPSIVSNYSYVRGGGFVTGPAMAVRGGQYLFSDTLTWETDQFTVLMAVVLRAPRGEWYSVLDSTPTLNGAEEPVSLRYHRSGVLALWAGGPLGEVQLQAGITRPNQPVIVGFTLNFADMTTTLLAVDTATHLVSGRLPFRPSLRPRLYLGYSKMGGAAASMEVLEVDYWTANLSEADMVVRMGALDRLYGVSSS